MNLDFAALEGTPTAQPMRQPWGQAGTVGTQAFMRVSASPGVGDARGTGGGGGATTPTKTGIAARVGDAATAACPQVPPVCPQDSEARKPKEIKASPVSPLVPGIGGKNESSGAGFDREAFEERAAIMEFDGGLPRAEAEAAALALLGAAGSTNWSN